MASTGSGGLRVGVGRAEAGCLCPMEPPYGHGGGHPGPEPATPHVFGGSCDHLVSLSPYTLLRDQVHPGMSCILCCVAIYQGLEWQVR